MKLDIEKIRDDILSLEPRVTKERIRSGEKKVYLEGTGHIKKGDIIFYFEKLGVKSKPISKKNKEIILKKKKEKRPEPHDCILVLNNINIKGREVYRCTECKKTYVI